MKLFLLILAFPTPEESDYLRRVLSVVDMRNELAKTRAISVSSFY